MLEKLKIIRVFIGSPGGLDDERQAAHSIVNEVNQSCSEHWGAQFKLLGWEDAIPGYQRPQDKINEDLDKCEYFVGVLWNRWGSQPSTEEGAYTSGFEEEFNRASQRIEAGQMKDMAIYFKTVDVPSEMQPGEDLKKVLSFREDCIAQKKVFFKEFNNLESFRDVVRAKLMEIGWAETEIAPVEEASRKQTEQISKSSEISEDSLESQATRLIDEKARQFLSELTIRPINWEETSAHEIARFRLIASSVYRSGNDDTYLGNHDANLVFQHLRYSQLSQQEIRVLVDGGITGFNYQNVPLWHWMVKSEEFKDPFYRIRLLATWGRGTLQKNAIQILELASLPVSSDNKIFDLKTTLERWFSEDTEDQTFYAAVSYLSENAKISDIELLEECSSNCPVQRLSKVESAIVGILARDNTETALNRLIEKEVDKLESGVLDALFESPQSLTTETVLKCLSAKSDDVRLKAANLLFKRDEIPYETLETLLTDSSYGIRLIAAESMIKLGQELNPDIVEKILIVDEKKGLLGIGANQNNLPSNSYYKRYLSNRLHELDFQKLLEKAREEAVFADQELQVLYAKYTSKMQAEIRSNIADGFKGWFEKSLEEMANYLKRDSNRIQRINKLEQFLRNRIGTSALAALCKLSNAQDLSLIRGHIDQFEPDGTDSLLKYLARFGDWSDIERIKNLKAYQDGQTNFGNTPFNILKSKTILDLGRNRVADLLEIELEATVRIALIKQIPQKVIVELNDEILLQELNRDDDKSRVVFALRCVQSLSKTRITSLLKKYTDSNEQRYYNSIHWLDLGASMPRNFAKSIAANVLNKQ